MTFSCFDLHTLRVFKIQGKNPSITEKPLPDKVGLAFFLSALDQHLHHGDKSKVLQSPMHFRIKKMLLQKYLGKIFQNCECSLWNLLLELQHLPGLATKYPM